MSLLVWVFYLVIGKIIIHIWMEFHLPKFAQKSAWVNQLHECDLCSGVWVYTVLAFVMGIGLLEATGFGNFPLIDPIVTGIITSWVVHIFTLGWKAKYSITVI